MQDRHGNSPVSQYSEKADRPVGGVTPDDGYFVAFLDTGMFQQDMKLLYPAGNVFEMVSMSIVIGESGEVPMLLHASLYKAQETIIHSDIILKRTGISVRMLQR